jgi:hypothetical protein
MSTISAGKVQVDNLTVQGLGAGAIQATNLKFNNLDVSGNLTLQGAPVATQAFVSSAVSGVIGSAGAALDTLGEIQAALGNDANLASTLTNSIATKANASDVTAGLALKANLVAPTFTGSVKVDSSGSLTVKDVDVSLADTSYRMILTSCIDFTCNPPADSMYPDASGNLQPVTVHDTYHNIPFFTGTSCLQLTNDTLTNIATSWKNLKPNHFIALGDWGYEYTTTSKDMFVHRGVTWYVCGDAISKTPLLNRDVITPSRKYTGPPDEYTLATGGTAMRPATEVWAASVSGCFGRTDRSLWRQWYTINNILDQDIVHAWVTHVPYNATFDQLVSKGYLYDGNYVGLDASGAVGNFTYKGHVYNFDSSGYCRPFDYRLNLNLAVLPKDFQVPQVDLDGSGSTPWTGIPFDLIDPVTGRGYFYGPLHFSILRTYKIKWHTVHRNPALVDLFNSCERIGIPDDHDSGYNDAGSTNLIVKTMNHMYKQIFPPAPGSLKDGPEASLFQVKYKDILTPSGQPFRIQTILLDGNFYNLMCAFNTFSDSDISTFLNNLRNNNINDVNTFFNNKEDIIDPTIDTSGIVMADLYTWGPRQLKLLEAELMNFADVRFIVYPTKLVTAVNWTRYDLSRTLLNTLNMINVFTSYAKSDCTTNFSLFMNIVMKTRAENVICVTGDYHKSFINTSYNAGYYPITEITSSGLTMGYRNLTGTNQNYTDTNEGISDGLKNNRGDHADWQPTTYTGFPDYTKSFVVVDIIFDDQSTNKIHKLSSTQIKVSCYACPDKFLATQPVTYGTRTRPVGYWGSSGQLYGGNFKCTYNNTWGQNFVKTWEKIIPLSTLKIPNTMNLSFKHVPVPTYSGYIGFSANLMRLVNNYDNNIRNWSLLLTVDDSPQNPDKITSKTIRIPGPADSNNSAADFPFYKFNNGNVFQYFCSVYPQGVEDIVPIFGKVGEVLKQTLSMTYIGSNSPPVGAWGSDSSVVSFATLNTAINTLLYNSPDNYNVPRNSYNITIDKIFTNLGFIA